LGGDADIRRTPLHDEHVAAGGRMVDFAGWRLPIQYSGLIDEHTAVRTRAGLFDVSHMGEAAVRGPQALDFLQKLTCNNVAKLQPGRAHYTALTRPEGSFVDDLLIYCLDESDFLLVLNAANTAKDLAWLREHAVGFDVEVQDESARWAQIALQGPAAVEIVTPLTDASPGELRYYGFARADVAGVPSILSRTGYTGEDGFEVYCPADSAPTVWRALMEAGARAGIAPAGLGARDTLRLEAKMALYGNDIDETTTVLEADLGWIVKLKKGDFIGRDVLARQKQEGVERKLIGFEMQGRAIPRHGYPVLREGGRIGEVTSGTFAPFLKKRIGLAYVPVDATEVGSELDVEIRGRAERAVVVPTPFYQRPRSG
jgi:aminomethyltransferase